MHGSLTMQNLSIGIVADSFRSGRGTAAAVLAACFVKRGSPMPSG